MELKTNKILIASLDSRLLEKPPSWFEKNKEKIENAARTSSFWHDNILFLEKNLKINLSHMLKKLDNMGYEKVQTLARPGEFSQRGNLIDIFPINTKLPVRVELEGNFLESFYELNISFKEEERKRFFTKKHKTEECFLKNLFRSSSLKEMFNS